MHRVSAHLRVEELRVGVLVVWRLGDAQRSIDYGKLIALDPAAPPADRVATLVGVIATLKRQAHEAFALSADAPTPERTASPSLHAALRPLHTGPDGVTPPATEAQWGRASALAAACRERFGNAPSLPPDDASFGAVAAWIAAAEAQL